MDLTILAIILPLLPSQCRLAFLQILNKRHLIVQSGSCSNWNRCLITENMYSLVQLLFPLFGN
jgi:hypothetical protein